MPDPTLGRGECPMRRVAGLHRALGGFAKRERECCDGTLTCLLRGCENPSVGYVATWHGAEPICEAHIPGAEQAGYIVQREETRRGEATNREDQAPLPASVSATLEGSQRGRNER